MKHVLKVIVMLVVVGIIVGVLKHFLASKETCSEIDESDTKQ